MPAARRNCQGLEAAMSELVDRVVSNVGLDRPTAEKAVGIILDFLSTEGPADKVRDLFDHRHLFVQHHLTEAQRKTLQRVSRGQPLLRDLREIMDEVYRLFDRRCRTDTALAKLARLRRRVRRFQRIGKTLDKLFSPNLEKALTFLDDKLLPSTSNAVERGNRRHRKMQKSVYRVRYAPQLRARIALDMLRESRATPRSETTKTLHYARAG